MITLQPESTQEHDLWGAALEIAAHMSRGWTLIGAQMVALHALEHGRTPMRTSADVDVLLDLRTVPRGTRQMSQLLVEKGFRLLTATPDGRGHRFVRGTVLVDVLAPDGLGERADLSTLPPARTVAVPGGSRALELTDAVEVRLDSRAGRLPRPNLLGAILVKARAVDVDDLPQAQRLDLAFLLSLVDDPRTLSATLGRHDRQVLRQRAEMLDPAALVWRRLPDGDDACRALRLLAGV